MQPVRYAPGEAIRWLQTGADSSRKQARDKGRAIIRSVQNVEQRALGKNVLTAAGALLEIGKSAWTDLLHAQAAAGEFLLEQESFSVIRAGASRDVPYKDVRAIQMKGDRCRLVLASGSVSIKPYAYIVAGRVKVPVGWNRNGLEVPFEMLIDELAARCGVDVQEA